MNNECKQMRGFVSRLEVKTNNGRRYMEATVEMECDADYPNILEFDNMHLGHVEITQNQR